MEFCPLAPDWGNVADWVGIAVAGVVGYGIWKLTQAANATTSSVAKLQIAADERMAREQDQERRLLLVGLAHPVAITIALALGVRAELAAIIDGGSIGERMAAQNRFRDDWIRKVSACELPIQEYVLDRLHLIGDPLASRILRARTWPASLALLFSVGQTVDVERMDRDAVLVLKGLRMLERDLGLIDTQCLNALREAGLNIPPDPEAERDLPSHHAAA